MILRRVKIIFRIIILILREIKIILQSIRMILGRIKIILRSITMILWRIKITFRSTALILRRIKITLLKGSKKIRSVVEHPGFLLLAIQLQPPPDLLVVGFFCLLFERIRPFLRQQRSSPVLYPGFV